MAAGDIDDIDAMLEDAYQKKEVSSPILQTNPLLQTTPIFISKMLEANKDLLFEVMSNFANVYCAFLCRSTT